MKKFEIKDMANDNKGLFVDNKFAGLYSEYFGLNQFSGNKDQIFDVDVCVEYLRKLKPDAKIYSAIQIAGNQFFLQVSFKPIILSEGVQTIHEPEL